MTGNCYRVAIILLVTQAAPLTGQRSELPDTVTVETGSLRVRGLVWRPRGSGPFPAVIFNHGSYSTDDPMGADEAATVGSAFADHGYVLLFLFRQGTGLSAGHGTSDGDQMASALATSGQAGRDTVQLRLLDGEEMDQALAGLRLLRERPDVDASHIAVAGHSFGGSLSLLMLERDAAPRAAVIFGGAAGSWEQSPSLRARLTAVVRRTSAPVFFIHAANDYSTASGKALALELRRLQKPYLLRIYPPVGRTSRDGHNLVYRSVATWQGDVFAFLDRYVRD